MERRWTINGRFLTQPVTGVQRYGRQIVAALDDLVGEGHALADGLALELAVPRGAETPELRHIPVRTIGRLSGHLWEQTELPAGARGGLLSLCNTGALAARRQIVCIHDLSPRTCPESFSLAFRTLYAVLVPALARRARQVATVSHHSAREIARAGMVPSGRIAVIPNGHEHALAWRDHPSPAIGEHAGPDTIVILGSLAPHKNVGLILGLAEDLRRAGLRIAVVGGGDPAIFADAGLPAGGPNVAWLGRLGDGELRTLLRASLCLAFPSLQEGFGLPPLEAMAVGCPVVVSDRASLPEVCGSAALYASPTEPAQWLDRILALRDSPALRRILSERGREQAKLFSWRRSGELYLEALLAADSRVSPVALAAAQIAAQLTPPAATLLP